MMKLRAALFGTMLLAFGLWFSGCGGEDGGDKSATVNILSVQPESSYPGVTTTISFEIAPGEGTSAEDLSWVVNFGDGQRVSGTELTSSVGHIYQAPQQYTVEVVAMAGDTRLADATAQVNILGPVDVALSATQGAPANIQVGEDLTISFSATNIEPGAVETPFEVSAYLSSSADVAIEDAGDLIFLGSTTAAAPQAGEAVIEAGDTAALGFTATIPEDVSPGDYHVVTWANPEGQFSDSDPTNNFDISERIVRVADPADLLPDLGVTNVVLIPDRAFPTLNEISRTFTVTNTGSVEAFGVVAKAWLSTGNQTIDPGADQLLEETAPFNVAPAGEQIFDVQSFVLDQEIVPPAGEEIEVYLVVEAAIQGDSGEVNLDNNIGASASPTIVTDKRVEGTDIVVSDFTVTPDSTYLDGTLQISMTLANEGTLDAGTFFCGIYMSLEPAVDTDVDPRLTNINVSGLPGDAERSIEKDIVVPGLFDPGTYYLYVVCDPLGALSESYRSNNQAIYETPVSITDEADVDLYVDSLAVPATAGSGEVVTLVATLCVGGSNASGSTRGQLWRSSAPMPNFTREPLLVFDIPNINPGECADVTIETEATCLNFEDQYSYGIKVDYDDRLPESDESNNTASGDARLAVTGQYCSCIPDTFANDTALGAYPVNPGPSEHQLCQPERCDFYRVELLADESVLISTTFDEARGELVTTLFDPSGVNQLDKSLTPGRQEVAEFLVPSAGGYIVSVCGAATDTQNLYNLGVEVLSPSAGVEVIPRALQVPVRDSFSIGSQLDISFRVYNLGQTDTPANFDANLVISPNPVIGDADDIPLDPATVSVAQVLAGSSRDINATVTIPTSVANGDYYLGVDLGLADTDTSNNQVASKLITVETLCYDPLEPNDSFNAAGTISAGSFSNLDACTAADDFYKLCVQNGKKFSVRADFDYSLGDIDLELFNQQLVRIDSSANVGVGSEQVSVDYVNGAQCYYVNVRLVAFQQVLQTSYDLTVAVQDVDPALQCGGTFESNDSVTSASSLLAALQSPATLDRCPVVDTDYYYVDLEAGQQVSFRGILDPAAQAGTLRIQLYKPGGFVGPNHETAPGAPIAEIADYLAPTTGTYYLQVTMSGSQRRATYRLEADGLDGLGGVDLAATNLLIGPGVYFPADQIRLGFTLSNLGTELATAPYYKVFLGHSATHNPSQDIFLGTVSLTSDVAGGATLNPTARMYLPGTGLWDGTGYLHVVVSANAQTDVDPANNVATTSITLSTN
jgi:hypothetical protein